MPLSNMPECFKNTLQFCRTSEEQKSSRPLSSDYKWDITYTYVH